MNTEHLQHHMNPEKKEAIFIAAAKLFANEGFYRVSVREICEAAGVTKPVLYYYFKDKESLLYELVQETTNIAQNLIKKHPASEGDFNLFLRGVVNLYAEFISQYPHLFRLAVFVQFMIVPESVKNLKKEIDMKNLEEFIGRFKKAQNDGILTRDAEPTLLVQNFVGTIIIVVSHHIREDSSYEKLFNELNKFYEFWSEKFLVKKS